MLDIVQTSSFKKDYKRLVKQGKDISMLKPVITTLQQQKALDPIYKDHPLEGNMKGFRECHIKGDWVLVYKTNDEQLILTLVRTGSHRDALGIE